MPEPEHSAWTGRTDGTPWMQESLIGLYRILPLWFLYGVMALVIPFYILFDGRGRRASWRFFRKRMGWGPFRSAVHVYLNMFNMGMVVLDRFAVYAGKKFRIDSEGTQLLQTYCSRGNFVMLSSHVGNYEIAGYSLTVPKRLNVLVYAGETATVMKNRERMFQNVNISMIPVSEDMSHIFRLNNALADGETVSLPADRLFGSSKAVRCPFMGEVASFPAGPFTLAHSRGTETIAVFCMKTGLRSYKAIVSEVSGNSVSEMAASFAGILEGVVRQWPDQWFNFYDFWE